MAVEKVKYNKTALKSQRDGLAKYEKFLPILQLKKMQLQLVLRQLEPKIEAKVQELSEAAEGIRPWSQLLSDPGVDIKDFLQVQEVRVEMDNIAGVEVREKIDLVRLHIHRIGAAGLSRVHQQEQDLHVPPPGNPRLDPGSGPG